MKNKTFRLLCTAGILTAVLCIQAFAAETAGGDAKLTSEWYGKLHEQSENFAFSPYSLRDCFRILYPAAAGQSKQEIESVLGLDAARAAKLKETDGRMIFRNDIGMKAANKAFVNSGVISAAQMHPEVLDADELDTAPFTDHTWEIINQFISDNTEEKIRDLVGPDTVTARTASVLVNCIYFKNTWDYDEAGILWKDGKRYRAFRSGSPSLRDIKETDTVDILRLPYLNAERTENEFGGADIGRRIEGMDQYSLYIICDRDDVDGLHADEWLKGKTEDELLEALRFDTYEGLKGYGEADFLVPCFEVRKQAELSGLLRDLGMRAPFDSGTRDFAAFAPVGIDEILQETWIRSDNGGTEAASTAMILKGEAARRPDQLSVKHVVADTDFAFFLKNDTAEEILFAGRIGDLAEAGEDGR